MDEDVHLLAHPEVLDGDYLFEEIIKIFLTIGNDIGL